MENYLLSHRETFDGDKTSGTDSRIDCLDIFLDYGGEDVMRSHVGNFADSCYALIDDLKIEFNLTIFI